MSACGRRLNPPSLKSYGGQGGLKFLLINAKIIKILKVDIVI
jgi:hypothetical protein